MDKNEKKNPDGNTLDEAETKKNQVNARIRKAQIDVKNVDLAELNKPKPIKPPSNKKRAVPTTNNAPTPQARSPCAHSPAKKMSEDLQLEVMKHLKVPQTPPKETERVRKRKLATVETCEEEEVSERKFISFIDQVMFIETGASLNTYFLTHLLNVAQNVAPCDAFNKNAPKNRSHDVFCIERTRVKLSKDVYIHANHIRFEKLPKSYIATQHPLEGTFNDFWAMIVEQRVETLVSLSHNGNDPSLFPSYYPNKPETFRNFGQLFVYCTAVTPPKTKYGCIEYKLELVVPSVKEERRKLRIYHYPHWGKNTVPANNKVVLGIVNKLGIMKKHQNPIVVQCETGVNQSAEVIYVDAMCSLLLYNFEANFDTIFRQMRNQRVSMMTQRLLFLHSISTVLEFIKHRFKPISSSLLSKLESAIFSISKDFSANMSKEPVVEDMRSPQIEKLIFNKDGN